MEVTKESNFWLSFEALRILGHMGYSDAIDRLFALANDQDVSIKIEALGDLGKIGYQEVLDELFDLAKNRNLDVSSTAFQALGHIGSEKSIDMLFELANDPEDFISTCAIQTLEKIDSKHAVSWLIEIANSQKNQVCREMMLKRIKDQKRREHIKAAKMNAKICSQHDIGRLLKLKKKMEFDLQKDVICKPEMNFNDYLEKKVDIEIIKKSLWDVSWKHKIVIRENYTDDF